VFTGIIEELGTVAGRDELADAARLAVRGPLVAKGATPGESIAVNGVCLTVIDCDSEVFTADVMRETLDRSSLGALRPGDQVNLERPVTLNARLGGHLVQGHVDGVGVVVDRLPARHWEVVRISLPADLGRYVVAKGSIAVDGVSLTVVESTGDTFTVAVVPHTASVTTLAAKGAGDRVNLEIDVVAKYVERLVAQP